MIQPWAVLAYSLAYVGFLFAIAYWGDERAAPARPPEREARRLRPLARGLLHLLDLLRQRRPGLEGGLQLPADLSRPDPGVRARLAAAAAHRADLQGPEHHLDRGLHRRALRQEPDPGRDRHRDRGARDPALHRAAAEGGLDQLPDPARVPGHRDALAHGEPAAVARHRADRIPDPGAVRDPVRHPPHRRDRAPRGHDPRDRVRIGGQADRVPGGRRVRHLGRFRRDRRARRQGRRRPAAPPPVRRRGRRHRLGHDDPARADRGALPAPSVPRGGRRERRRGRHPQGRLAVPGLSRDHQPVRRAGRDRGPAAVPGRRCRRRHVRARAADGAAARSCSRCSPSSAASRPRPAW